VSRHEVRVAVTGRGRADPLRIGRCLPVQAKTCALAASRRAGVVQSSREEAADSAEVDSNGVVLWAFELRRQGWWQPCRRRNASHSGEGRLCRAVDVCKREVDSDSGGGDGEKRTSGSAPTASASAEQAVGRGRSWGGGGWCTDVPRARQHLDDDHRCTAVPAHEGRRRGSGGGLVGFGERWRRRIE